MKGINNKKGFTLIELLAVIVVLAVVTVLATTTVLPYMTNAYKTALADEANMAVSAAGDAISLIELNAIQPGTNSADYKKVVEGGKTTYCFTLKKLVDFSILEKDLDGYEGSVVATKDANGKFTYVVAMHNKDYEVVREKGSGFIDSSDVSDYKAPASGTHENASDWSCTNTSRS